ncbi:tail fiber protein [Chromatiaceae bacterium AAb-1]|nr:tail fiber protein [Chromatiaceae bacterium AAb-1]
MAEPFLGEIRLFAFGTIPSGWLPCNGQLLNIQNYQALFAILGATYGGDGRITFALPNLEGRSPLHPSPEIPPGTRAGEATHVLTLQEIPEHTHAVSASSNNATAPTPANNVWATVPANTIYAATADTTMNSKAIGIAGASQPHNNMQPYQAVSFCIAIQGYWPSRP